MIRLKIINLVKIGELLSEALHKIKFKAFCKEFLIFWAFHKLQSKRNILKKEIFCVFPTISVLKRQCHENRVSIFFFTYFDRIYLKYG